MADTPTKVAVLISGRGSNMLALADAVSADGFPAKIVGVIADKADAAGLAAARARGIEAVALPKTKELTKHEHEALVQAQLETWETEIVCLAGYMRLLSGEFTTKWPKRLINIHPSLLPKHKGLDTHQRAIDANDSQHGCSVHYVTAGMDEGPVIAQARIDIKEDDTAESLAAKVLVEEHKLYPAALRMVIERLSGAQA